MCIYNTYTLIISLNNYFISKAKYLKFRHYTKSIMYNNTQMRRVNIKIYDKIHYLHISMLIIFLVKIFLNNFYN